MPLSSEPPLGPPPRPLTVGSRWHPLGRAGAYLLAVILANLLASSLVVISFGLRGQGAATATSTWTPDAPVILVATVTFSAIVLLFTDLFLKHLDGTVWSALLPMSGRLRAMSWGILLAVVILGGLAACLAIAGWLCIDGWRTGIDPPRTLAYVLLLAAVFLLQGGTEEVICRGYLFRNLIQWRGPIAALLVTSPAFGILHSLNPGVSPLALINTAVMGLLLGLLTVRVSIWAAIGFHAAWNFLLAAVVSVPLSGMPIMGVLNARLEGPTLWTGGAFGPEASLVVTILTLGGSALLLGLPGLGKVWGSSPC